MKTLPEEVFHNLVDKKLTSLMKRLTTRFTVIYVTHYMGGGVRTCIALEQIAFPLLVKSKNILIPINFHEFHL